MKSNNSTLPLPGCSISLVNFHKHFRSVPLLLPFLLVSSLLLTAGDTNKNPDKLSANNYTNAFSGSTNPLSTESFRTNLYLLNANNTTILADGVLTEYNNLYHDSVTLEDAYKFTNINENLGLTRYGKILAVERRPIFQQPIPYF